MQKKEFVPLLNQRLEVLNQAGKWKLYQKKILKKDDKLQHDYVKEYVLQEINKNKVNIYLFEHDGNVQGVQFNCQCGARAVLQFEDGDEEA